MTRNEKKKSTQSIRYYLIFFLFIIFPLNYLHFDDMSVGQANVTYTVQGGRLGELFQVQQTGPDGFPPNVYFFTVRVSVSYGRGGVHDCVSTDWMT